MAILGASFSIGRSALAAYQAAISISGQNIANVGNPDYARQSGRLTAEWGGPVEGGITPGGGVRLSALRRHVDDALDARLRLALGERSSHQTVYGTLSQVEALYNELSEQDVSTQLSQFLAGFSQLQTSPTDSGIRNVIVSNANTLIDSVSRQRSGLLQQVDDLNAQAVAGAQQVSDMAEQIAQLNELIVSQESTGNTVASALRDRRDSLLRELGEFVDVQTRERDNGSVAVYVNSEPLVEYDRARALTAETELVDGLEIVRVRFADSRAEIHPTAGALAGVLAARDTHIRGQLSGLDQFVSGLIYEVNRIHSAGVGLLGYTNSVADNAARDADLPLNADSNLPFPLQNGTFIVHVRDRATGQVITRQIEVDLDGLNGDDTSLNDLAAALDGVPGLGATVRADNRLSLSADNGQEFWFSEDSSGALAALGVNSFFTGTTAGDIEVAEPIASDPRRIAASLTGLSHDGDNAGRIALLAAETSGSALLQSRSLGDFHDLLVGELSSSAAAARSGYEAADAVHAGLYAQREAVSGVSLDEEAINLQKFERAYQGAARYVSVLDELTTELLRLL